MDRIEVSYRVRGDQDAAERQAREIALEQTVEVPASLVEHEPNSRELVGEVTAVTQLVAPDAYQVTIAYRPELVSNNLGQLLNLIYGNISLKSGIRLTGLCLPKTLISQFPGPRFGVEGLRRLLGIFGRPLLATALKPRGASADRLAEIARDFVTGGGDVLKDDHNLVDATFDEFKSRVSRIQDAVSDAAERRGRPAAYLPNLSVNPVEIPRYLDYLARQGIAGVLVAPLILGLEPLRWIREHSPLFVMAHPTFTGQLFHDPVHGVEPSVLLGTLFRLAGADSSIFPNAGGRFTLSPEVCGDIAKRLRAPLASCREAWPAPAGGMRLDAVPRMAREFGSDAIHLVGGALLQDQAGVRAATERFQEGILEHFEGAPAAASAPPASSNGEFVSACEVPVVRNGFAEIREHLPFREGFRWEGREPTPYKPSAELPFDGVNRVELIGHAGESAAFDVRYFEIAPGGYSSREKHRHTHVVVGLRGTGILESGESAVTLDQFDVAYVPPLRVHQLRNTGSEPFGFLCIVDRDRDRPMAP